MNEKFLELAKQCGYWSGQTIEMNDVGIEKFAELIVRECLSYAKEGDLDFMKFMIKRNFGVEE